MFDWETASVLNDRYEENRAISLLAKDQYMREVRWREPLSDEERQKLLDSLARARREPENAWRARLSREARDRLIADFQPLVLHVARRYIRMHPGLEVLDLVQEANLVLLRMFERCEIPNVKALQTLAFRYMRGAMLNVENDRKETVHLSWRIQKDLKAFETVRFQLREDYAREPSYQELASALGVSVLRVCELVDYELMHCVLSLQSLVAEDFHEDQYRFVSAFGTQASECLGDVVLCDLVRWAVEKLSPLQQQVVCLFCSLDEEATGTRDRQDVAALLGIPASTVSTTFLKAKNRLRHLLAPALGLELDDLVA